MVSKGRKQEVAGPLKLDLGCGANKREGFEGVDIAKIPGVNKVFDLRKTPWPWKDKSVNEIYCSQFFEHLTAPERIKFMEECYRILEPNGKLQIIVPVGDRMFQDPTHQWPPVVVASFLYFNKGWIQSNKLEHQHNYKCDFDFTYGWNVMPPWNTKHEEARNFAMSHYNNVLSDLYVNLVKR